MTRGHYEGKTLHARQENTSSLLINYRFMVDDREWFLENFKFRSEYISMKSVGVPDELRTP
jgi:DNA-dependent RNA polymerase auxiliary subunit epsilon